MNKQRLTILIVAALGVLATFMPWIKAPLVGTINGTSGDGWITLGLFVVPLVISLINDRTKALKGLPLYGAIIPGLIAGSIGLWKIVDFNSKMSELGDNPFAQALGASITIEFGLYQVVLAGIALPIVAFIMKDTEQEAEQT
jgi:ABC-type phosphate transport system permease subunit